VEPFHLFRYLDEQAYRYNNRKDESGESLSDFDRFKVAMSQVVGKRLTWNVLTGKELDSATCSNWERTQTPEARQKDVIDYFSALGPNVKTDNSFAERLCAKPRPSAMRCASITPCASTSIRNMPSSLQPEDIKLLLNKLITESTKVRALLRSSDSPEADWFLSTCGRFVRADDGLLELVPSNPDSSVDKLSLKESVLVACLSSFKQPEDFSNGPFAGTIFANPDSFNLSLGFDLPDGSSLILLGMVDPED
jgi:hypothetical protein